MKSIQLILKKATCQHEFGDSHFFGCCDIPVAWEKGAEFGAGVAFLAQLRLSEVKSPLLPSKGMLYIFIDTARDNEPIVRFSPIEEDEPKELEDVEFNDEIEDDYNWKDEYLVSFKEKNEIGHPRDGMKLFGEPADLAEGDLYGKEKGAILLFQYDPYAAGKDTFLIEMDGYYYVLIKPEDLKALKFNKAMGHEERS